MREITLFEHTDPDGVLIRVRLYARAGQCAIDCEGKVLPLPDGALDRVMQRYGKPLAAEVSPAETLELDSGEKLVRFRFRRRYDVIARDYVAYYAPGREPLSELATGVTAALQHLAKSLDGAV